MSRACPNVGEPHTCAFCEKHFALDFSKVNGAISPTRLEQMQRRLIQVGFLGQSENLNDEKYVAFRRVLENYHIYDMHLNLCWSNAAENCLLAGRIRECVGQKQENDEKFLLSAAIQRSTDEQQDIFTIACHDGKFDPSGDPMTDPHLLEQYLRRGHRPQYSEINMGSMVWMEVLTNKGMNSLVVLLPLLDIQHTSAWLNFS